MPCRSHEGGGRGVERPHLRGRQVGQHRAPARGQVGGQPDPDVGDQRRSAGGALLEDVEDVAAVQHREVGALAGPVDQLGERPPGDALQRPLPRVAAADLERRHPEPVAVLVGQVHDEALGDHRG